MQNSSRNWVAYLLIVLIASLFFIPFLGGVHLFDWDEVNFAEIAREMLVTNNYLQVQINFEPFFEKPPLFFWFQVLSMKLFGVNEFAARFPNAVVGIVTLLVLYKTGTKLFNRKFGFLWALAYFGSILPHFYFRSGIIDPMFNLFIFIGIYYFIKFKWKKENMEGIALSKNKNVYLLLGGLFIGLAMLTKGPVAYLIVFLAILVYWISIRFKMFVSIPQFFLYSVYAAIIMLIWIGIEWMKNGPEFIVEFIIYQIRLLSTQDAGHAGFPGYHVVVLIVGCFPASLFAIRAFYKMQLPEKHQQDFRKWMMILFWVVLGLFSFVSTKIVHYSSMAYFPVTFLGALTIYQILGKKINLTSWMKFGVLALGLPIGLFVIGVPFIGQHIELIKPIFKDDINALAVLDAHVIWTGWEAIAGILLMASVILFLVFVNKDKLQQAFYSLFFGTALFLFIGLIFYIGRIEMYTQNAYVEMSKSLIGKQAQLRTEGFKSYVHLFYTKRQPTDKPAEYNSKLLEEYVFSKKGLEKYWEDRNDYEILKSKNGYLMLKKK
jgi:4-amino-4-deoxy-L-arabinose transferase-like glycosyltransferase